MRKKISNIFLDILYPRRCPVCHDIAAPKGQKVCTMCKEKLRPITGARCFCCSKPLKNKEQEYCNDCKKPRQFDQGFGIFSYGSVLQESLFKLKYGKRQEYGVFYGQFAAAYSRDLIQQWNVEVLVPVPLHRKREEKRGYNQAALIAEAMGKSLGIPVDCKLLKRIVHTKPQKELDSKERRANLRNAFALRKQNPYKRLLLIDDIYTTGATIEAAAAVLRKAGAEKIYFIAVAMGGDT